MANVAKGNMFISKAKYKLELSPTHIFVPQILHEPSEIIQKSDLEVISFV